MEKVLDVRNSAGLEMVGLYHGDCLEVIGSLPDNSVDAVVTDPPYGIGFQGKQWDQPGAFVKRKPARENKFDHIGGNHNPSNPQDAARTALRENGRAQIWHQRWAEEVLSVIKPGGYLLAFGGTRTYHRMACAIEDAGFEIRDSIYWLYGSGFPKSMDISKAMDKAAGAAREVVGRRKHPTLKDSNLMEESANAAHGANSWSREWDITAPATENAYEWQGWGTALKPAVEPIVMARKPLSEKTVVANVLKWGTGAINVDACRIPHEENRRVVTSHQSGRWPANVILDGSPEVVDLFPASSVTGKRSERSQSALVENTHWLPDNHQSVEYTESGSAARFFYCAKASKKDRGEGNNHPTVKPIDLMQYLCRLVTPSGGIILDPFLGSGTTAIAALQEGFRVIGIEREADYVAIAKSRTNGVITPFFEIMQV